MLALSATTDMFGTSIFLNDPSAQSSEQISSNLSFNPLDQLGPVKDGYLFRSPSITVDVLDTTLRSFDGLNGPLAISITKDDESGEYEGMVEVQNKSDAALFAWANLDHWQKWSKKQSQDLETSRQSASKSKTTVNPDGSVRVTVTVDELRDDDD